MTMLMVDDETGSPLVAELPAVQVGIFVHAPAGSWAPDDIIAHLDCVEVGIVVPGFNATIIEDPDIPDPDPPAPAPPTVSFITPPPALSVAIGGSVPGAWWDPSCQHEMSAHGTGSVTVPSDAAVGGVGDMMTFRVNGVNVHASLVESVARQTVSQQEGPGQVYTYTGRGIIAEMDRVITYPDLGSNDPTEIGEPFQFERHFNWTASTGVDTTKGAWTNCEETEAHYGEPADSPTPPRFIRPEGWPTSFSKWIWDRDAASPVPTGDMYFSAVIPIPPAGRYQAWMALDDEGEVWFDGTRIYERSGYYTGQAEKVEMQLSANYHFVRARVTNRTGRGGFNMAICPVAGSGILGLPIVTTGNTWRCNPYPKDPPGMTPGQVINILFDEAAARGCLTGWGRAFTDKTDSNGKTWTIYPDITVKVGMSLLAVLDQLAATYIDYDYIGRRLYMWEKDTSRGSASAPADVIDASIVTEI